MKIPFLLLCMILGAVLLCGCTSQNQDDSFKVLVQNVSTDFQGQSELIVKPYQGMTVTELCQYRNAAASAKAAAESMTLSDSAGKARGMFILAMNSTVSAVDTLEQNGKLDNPDERVTTESISAYFVTTQSKLDDTCRMLKIEKPKIP